MIVTMIESQEEQERQMIFDYFTNKNRYAKVIRLYKLSQNKISLPQTDENDELEDRRIILINETYEFRRIQFHINFVITRHNVRINECNICRFDLRQIFPNPIVDWEAERRKEILSQESDDIKQFLFDHMENRRRVSITRLEITKRKLIEFTFNCDKSYITYLRKVTIDAFISKETRIRSNIDYLAAINYRIITSLHAQMTQRNDIINMENKYRKQLHSREDNDRLTLSTEMFFKSIDKVSIFAVVIIKERERRKLFQYGYWNSLIQMEEIFLSIRKDIKRREEISSFQLLSIPEK